MTARHVLSSCTGSDAKNERSCDWFSERWSSCVLQNFEWGCFCVVAHRLSPFWRYNLSLSNSCFVRTYPINKRFRDGFSSNTQIHPVSRTSRRVFSPRLSTWRTLYCIVVSFYNTQWRPSRSIFHERFGRVIIVSTRRSIEDETDSKLDEGTWFHRELLWNSDNSNDNRSFYVFRSFSLTSGL